MDRLFLDANILFSAAYREDSGLLRLWNLPDVKLVTSSYAAEEARRNLDTAEMENRLENLLKGVHVVSVELFIEIPGDVTLPEKDIPILRSALTTKSTHLLTGDVKHFGPLFGKSAGGVLVMRPAAYLKTKE